MRIVGWFILLAGLVGLVCREIFDYLIFDSVGIRYVDVIFGSMLFYGTICTICFWHKKFYSKDTAKCLHEEIIANCQICKREDEVARIKRIGTYHKNLPSSPKKDYKPAKKRITL